MKTILKSLTFVLLICTLGLSLFSCYTLKTGELIYVTNGGSFTEEPSKRLTVGYKFELPRSIHKEHATFVGWYADKGFTERMDIVTPEEWGDITAYAKWVEHIDIIYKNLDGVVIENESEYTRSFVPWLDELVLPEVSKDGEVFSGWYFDKALTDEATPKKILEMEESFVLYPKWD